MFSPANNNVQANSIFNRVASIWTKEKRILAIILPRIENAAKVIDNFKFVLFCFKYEMNPAKEENNIINVEVLTAVSMGIKKSKVIIETKNTPPPTPAMTETAPERKPRKIKKKIMINVNSIFGKINLKC